MSEPTYDSVVKSKSPEKEIGKLFAVDQVAAVMVAFEWLDTKHLPHNALGCRRHDAAWEVFRKQTAFPSCCAYCYVPIIDDDDDHSYCVGQLMTDRQYAALLEEYDPWVCVDCGESQCNGWCTIDDKDYDGVAYGDELSSVLAAEAQDELEENRPPLSADVNGGFRAV